MSMTLTGLIPVLEDALDVVSREQVGMIPAVSRDSKTDMAALDQTVTSHVAPASTAYDVEASITNPDNGDQTIGTVEMKITKSRYVPIRWNGEEQLSVTGRYSNIVRDQIAQALRTITNEVESDLAGLYPYASRAYGAAGVTPFGIVGDLSDFAGVVQILKDNGAPKTDLRLVLGSSAIFNIQGKQSGLLKVNEAGTDDLLRNGIIGRVNSLMVGDSAEIKTHTKGTGAGLLVNNGSGVAVGDTAIAADTGTGTILPGDVVTFAADTVNQYVAASALSGGSFSLAAPGARAAIANNNAITIGNGYTGNLGFARSAIHLATRMPALPTDENGVTMDSADDMIVITDPVSGLSFQVLLYRERRRIRYEIAMAWGVKAVKPEHICLLLG